jgi:hypothetical protein
MGLAQCGDAVRGSPAGGVCAAADDGGHVVIWQPREVVVDNGVPLFVG